MERRDSCSDAPRGMSTGRVCHACIRLAGDHLWVPMSISMSSSSMLHSHLSPALRDRYYPTIRENQRWQRTDPWD